MDKIKLIINTETIFYSILVNKKKYWKRGLTLIFHRS